LNIGVFDSGLGGLSVVHEISHLLKGSNLVYVADTAYAPYGDKTQDEILERCIKITQFLILKYEIKAIVLACNTATSASIKELRKIFKTLVVIGCEPGIKPALALSKSNKIGVLATQLTLKGEKYKTLVKDLASEKETEFFEQACSGLVEEIEAGNIRSLNTKKMLGTWLEPMKNKNVDSIVLGCTHYSLISPLIKEIMPADVNIIETSKALATRLQHLSLEEGHINEGDLRINILYTGDINTKMIDMIFENTQQNMTIGKYEI